MVKCFLCPRDCGVDRSQGEIGCCAVTNLMAARAALHFWEEPILSGQKGSGAIFFSGCNLHCVFCQNQAISNGEAGKSISQERLTEICLELQAKEAHNINLVTGTHFTPQIAAAIRSAKEQGLRIPVIWNSSAYEKPETLRLLEGAVDIWLPDLKYISSQLSALYSHAANYFAVAKEAIQEMFRQCGPFQLGSDGMLKRGMIIRYLLLPGCVEDGKQVLRYVHETYGDAVFLSVMNQYTPLPHVANYPALNRKVTQAEYEELLDYAESLDIEYGFLQEGDAAEESFIPQFNGEGL